MTGYLKTRKMGLPDGYGLVAQAPEFPRHLAALRRQRGFTQQTLAEKVGVRGVRLQRYEPGTSQPTFWCDVGR